MKAMGIDVSMQNVDVALCEDGKTFYHGKIQNDKKGFLEIANIVKRSKVDLVVMEATGVYHTQLADYLYEKNIKVSVVNPLIIKRFTQMKLSRTKTDKKDSILIALYGYQENPKLYKPKSEEENELKSLYITRKGLKKDLKQTKNRLHALSKRSYHDSFSLFKLNQLKATLEEMIKEIEDRIRTLLKTRFREEYDLLKDIPGVGLIGIAGIMGMLGGFENFENPKQVSAYIGINPSQRQSGKSLNLPDRISKKGNSNLREQFYMMALSAKSSNKACKIFYERLLENGKSKKQALIAVANKLIRQVMSILKYKVKYNENHISVKKVA